MMRTDTTIERHHDSGVRRAVYFSERWPPGDAGNGYLFRVMRRWDRLHFNDRYRSDDEDEFAVPEYMARAFEAGEPIEPILDYLLETYEDSRPWLAGAVARVLTGAHA